MAVGEKTVYKANTTESQRYEACLCWLQTSGLAGVGWAVDKQNITCLREMRAQSARAIRQGRRPHPAKSSTSSPSSSAFHSPSISPARTLVCIKRLREFARQLFSLSTELLCPAQTLTTPRVLALATVVGPLCAHIGHSQRQKTLACFETDRVFCCCCQASTFLSATVETDYV
jgi:hypothetical protein